jgi:hypothetical protein
MIISKFRSSNNTYEMFHLLSLTENESAQELQSLLKCFVLYFERKHFIKNSKTVLYKRQTRSWLRVSFII